MFEKLRKKISTYCINREISASSREKIATNITRAKTVGILFSLDNEQHYEKISQIIDNLTVQKKTVQAIAFVPSKQIPNFFIPKMKISVFTSNNLNLVGIPNSGFIKDFINNKFDILIDLTLTDYLPLYYIAGVSQATFKAGRYQKKMVQVFDFLVRKRDDMTDSEYFKYLLDYLTKINLAEK